MIFLSLDVVVGCDGWLVYVHQAGTLVDVYFWLILGAEMDIFVGFVVEIEI